MEIDNFFWLDQIIDKISVKHGIEPWEVEEVFRNGPHIRFRQKGEREGENLYSASGQTDAGRYLIVLFIYKPPVPNRQSRLALVISARDMALKERRQYERR